MQFTVYTTLAALAATVIAGPVPGANHHPPAVEVLFIGAADASYTWEFDKHGTDTAINNDLSVSKISTPAGVSCTFHGIDGSVTQVGSQQVVDVGPPQTQISGSCWGLWK